MAAGVLPKTGPAIMRVLQWLKADTHAQKQIPSELRAHVAMQRLLIHAVRSGLEPIDDLPVMEAL